MKKQGKCIKYIYLLLTGSLLMFSGCTQMSEHEIDPSAGLNGGFEVSKNGLPVNWLMYTANTVPDADFKVVFDDVVYTEGKQSLRFDVKKCSSTGGWHSPGFTNEFFDIGRFEGEGIYILSFWIKNDGSTFNISGGGVGAKKGEMKTLIEGNEPMGEWQFHEFEIEVPADRWLRMQLNILKPGTFWIDDVRVVRE